MPSQKERELRDRLKSLTGEARQIAETAETQGRDFGVGESAAVKHLLDQAKSVRKELEPFDIEVEKKKTLDEFGASVDLLGSMPGQGSFTKAGSAAPGSWGKSVLDHLSGLGAKALTAAGTAVAPPAWSPEVIGNGERPNWLTDIIPSVSIPGDEYVFWRQTVRTNNAAPVALGALKPTSVFTVEKVTARARTIAHLSEAIPRQDLSDSQSLVEFLDSELRLGLKMAVDTQTLTGSGVGENFTGLANTSGIQTQAKGADSNIVALRKAKTKVENFYAEPSHYVLNPADWEKVDLAVDNEQRYYLSGPADASSPRLWGVPVLISEATPAGTGYVGAFRTQARYYVREGVRLDWSENTGTDFTLNLVRWRAEQRLNVAFLRPATFVQITGIS